MIRRITLVSILVMCTVVSVSADTYVVDPNHSEIGFKVRHLVSRVPGRFTTFSGTFNINSENMTESTAELTIETASISTNVTDRDNHLRSEDFFHAEKYPQITFKSSKIRKTGKDKYDVDGILTMRGVSQPITIDVEFLGFGSMGKTTKAGFEATAKVNRKDFDILWNRALDHGGTILGDDVTISINLELNKQE